MVANEISSAVFQAMTGKAFDPKAIPAAGEAQAHRVMQVINTLIGFCLPPIVTAYVLHRRPFALLGFTGPIKKEQLGLMVLIVGTSLIVGIGLSYFNTILPTSDSLRQYFDQKELEYNQHIEAIVVMRDVSDFIIGLIVMGFLPSLCEETLFRGGLQNFLSRGSKMPWLSIVVVSILFSLAHFSYYGFFSRLFLGIVLGALYHYSGRLWLCILAHFINNALALTILFSNTQKGKTIKEAMQSNSGATWWGILLLPIVIGLFILFKRLSASKRDWSNQ